MRGALVLDGSTKWLIIDDRDGTPVGRVVGDLSIRPGYIKANGATVTRAAYPRLWKFASDNNLTTANTATYPGLFGIGDGATTFVVPDWRGVVARYLDDGKGYDSGRSLGSYEADMVMSHAHNIQVNSTATGGTRLAVGTGNAGSGAISTDNFGGTETRMKNIAELAVIRYK